MICPRCGWTESSVQKTETIQESVFTGTVKRRKRKCKCGIKGRICESIFTTFEISSEDFEILKQLKQKHGKFSASSLTEGKSESAGVNSLIVRPRKKA